MGDIFNCRFCGERHVVAWYEGPDYKSVVRTEEEEDLRTSWPACSACYRLVEREDHEGPVRRGIAHGLWEASVEEADQVRGLFEERFWSPRTHGRQIKLP